MVSTIDRKLLRDLRHLRGQIVTIALVVASGIASYVALEGTVGSLRGSRDSYYAHSRFADVFAHLESAPVSFARELEAIDGVARVQTRIVKTVMVPIATLEEPAVGNVISIDARGDEPLNALHLTGGRWIEAGRDDEAILLQSFADAHHIVPGARVPAVINGTLRPLRIVGIAMSPEYVFPLPVGGISADPKRFAVFWMDREIVAPAFGMKSAFNDVVMRLQPGASGATVRDVLDRKLERYGGLGAVGRDKQPSNYALEGEMSQLASIATVVPFIFLSVAAFLLNVVLSRLVNLQRSQIAVLKAVGYRDRDVAIHYLKLVSVIVLAGAALGIALGAWLGSGLLHLYTQFFRFPLLELDLDVRLVVVSVGVSLAAALTGAIGTALRVAKLPPAEAMRPPAPATYRRTLIERLGAGRLLSASTRMIVREIARRPLRTLLSSAGIALGVGILVVSRFQADSVENLIEVQFHRAWREDASVALVRPIPARALHEIEHLPGVVHAEGGRMVAVRWRAGAHWRDSAIVGQDADGALRQLLDVEGHEVALPRSGVLLSRKLAEILHVGPGDDVEVEIREGDRRPRTLRVAGTVDDAFGLLGTMRLDTLWRWLGEDGAISTVLLRIDPPMYRQVQRRLKEMPSVASVTSLDMIVSQFREQSADWMWVMTLVMTMLASTITIGVVYNNARVSLSLRSRDLASLRVLGLTRGEISYILLGELAVQLVAAIPLGLLVGTGMVHAMMATVDPEQYRFAIVLSARTYVFAALVALAAGVVSGLLVRRRLDRLDLIAVLKARE